MLVNKMPFRPEQGRSLISTGVNAQTAGNLAAFLRKMLAMLLTTVLALAVLPGSIRAEDSTPHVTAVAVAHAHIVAGVRVSPDRIAATDSKRSSPVTLAKLRAAPCPEVADPRCKLLVLDMQ